MNNIFLSKIKIYQTSRFSGVSFKTTHFYRSEMCRFAIISHRFCVKHTPNLKNILLFDCYQIESKHTPISDGSILQECACDVLVLIISASFASIENTLCVLDTWIIFHLIAISRNSKKQNRVYGSTSEQEEKLSPGPVEGGE